MIESSKFHACYFTIGILPTVMMSPFSLFLTWSILSRGDFETDRKKFKIADRSVPELQQVMDG